MRRAKWVIYGVPMAIALVIYVYVYARGWLPGAHASSVLAAVVPGCAVLSLLTGVYRRVTAVDGVALLVWGALCGAYPASVSPVSDGLLMSTFGVDDILAWKLSKAIVAPILEEAAKGLGVLWALSFLPRRSWSAGFFYASLIGVGFAMFESTTYYDRLGLSWELLELRLVSPIRHSAYTACFGMALGALWTRRWWLRWPGSAGGYLLGIAFHALQNTPTRPGELPSSLVVVAGWLATLFAISRYDRERVEQPVRQSE